MFNLLPLHAIAGPRGDGLHPLVLALLERRRSIAAAGTNVEDIAHWRGDPYVQSGPNPVGDAAAVSADDLLRFEARTGTPCSDARTALVK